jgi:hypothetical protein
MSQVRAASYILFKEQSALFRANLPPQPPVQIVADLCNISADYDGPRLLGFAPNSWGCKASRTSSGQGGGFGPGVGVGYAFYYATNRALSPFVRLSSSVENPFKEKFRERFKDEVSEVVRLRSIALPPGCRIWPHTKFADFRFQGKSLIECQPVPLEKDTWSKVLENYKILTRVYNEVVAQLLRKYYADGAFKVEIRFD